MATIGRWTVVALAAVTFSLAQSLLRWTVGVEWTVWIYELVAFSAFGGYLYWLIFVRREPAAAAQPGPRGEGRRGDD